nr:MAG TPA: hypothetical protein [Caudoviricetes sp.]
MTVKKKYIPGHCGPYSGSRAGCMWTCGRQKRA